MTIRMLRNVTLAVALSAAAACTTTVYDDDEPVPPPPAPAVEPAPPPVQGGISFFYDSLSPYGSWVTVATYGQVWVPRVTAWWRPYTVGNWAYTEVGWTWVSAEPWGWAAYHYGRWSWDAEYGWAWVPGSVWAPAWVAWRSGGGRIGWAPLPPSVRWEAGIGFPNGGVGFATVIAPEHWCFVDERYITAPAIHEYVLPRAQNVTFVHVTNNITNYTVVNNTIVNNSINVTHIENVTHQPVPRYHIVDRESPAGLHAQALQSNEIPMVRNVQAVHRTMTSPSEPVHARTGEVRSVHVTSGTAASTTATSNTETVEEVERRHALEVQELRTKEQNDRVRLQQIHQTETVHAPANVTAEQLKARHLAEQQALEAQHQKEEKLLAARHQRELKTVTTTKTNVKQTKKTPKDKHEKDDNKGQ